MGSKGRKKKRETEGETVLKWKNQKYRKEIATHRERERERETHTHTHTDRLTDKQTDRQTDKTTDRDRNRLTEKE